MKENKFESIRPKSGLTYALKYAAYHLKQGIGKSKHKVYKENGGKSPYVHSYSTFNRYMGIAKEFVNWAKAQGINKLHKVEYEHVKKFLLQKAENGASKKTLKVNMSALKKFFEVVKREDIAKQIDKNYVDIYTRGQYNGRAMPFDKPMQVIERIKNPAHKVMAELQYLTGARLGDLKKMKIDEERKAVIIEKSKGGKRREISYVDRPEKFERIKELHRELQKYMENEGWKNLRKSYPESVRYAARRAGEIYSGTHSFRVNYAQERYKELVEKGEPEFKALKKVTEELGHNRISMAKYYVGA